MQGLVTQAQRLLGPLDSRLMTLISLVTLLLLILASLVLSTVGGLFLISLLLITAYLSSDLAQRRGIMPVIMTHHHVCIYRSRGLGNYFRGWVAARTRWCSRMEYESILLPPDVDQALESLYERVIREHVRRYTDNKTQCFWLRLRQFYVLLRQC